MRIARSARIDRKLEKFITQRMDNVLDDGSFTGELSEQSSSGSNSTKKIECAVCSLPFNSLMELREHKWNFMHHLKLEKFNGQCKHECDLCNVTSDSLADFSKHIESEAHKRFLSTYYLQKDAMKSAGRRPYNSAPWLTNNNFSTNRNPSYRFNNSSNSQRYRPQHPPSLLNINPPFMHPGPSYDYFPQQNQFWSDTTCNFDQNATWFAPNPPRPFSKKFKHSSGVRYEQQKIGPPKKKRREIIHSTDSFYAPDVPTNVKNTLHVVHPKKKIRPIMSDNVEEDLEEISTKKLRRKEKRKEIKLLKLTVIPPGDGSNSSSGESLTTVKKKKKKLKAAKLLWKKQNTAANNESQTCNSTGVTNVDEADSTTPNICDPEVPTTNNDTLEKPKEKLPKSSLDSLSIKKVMTRPLPMSSSAYISKRLLAARLQKYRVQQSPESLSVAADRTPRSVSESEVEIVAAGSSKDFRPPPKLVELDEDTLPSVKQQEREQHLTNVVPVKKISSAVSTTQQQTVVSPLPTSAASVHCNVGANVVVPLKHVGAFSVTKTQQKTSTNTANCNGTLSSLQNQRPLNVANNVASSERAPPINGQTVVNRQLPSIVSARCDVSSIIPLEHVSNTFSPTTTQQQTAVSRPPPIVSNVTTQQQAAVRHPPPIVSNVTNIIPLVEHVSAFSPTTIREQTIAASAHCNVTNIIPLERIPTTTQQQTVVNHPPGAPDGSGHCNVNTFSQSPPVLQDQRIVLPRPTATENLPVISEVHSVVKPTSVSVAERGHSTDNIRSSQQENGKMEKLRLLWDYCQKEEIYLGEMNKAEQELLELRNKLDACQKRKEEAELRYKEFKQLRHQLLSSDGNDIGTTHAQSATQKLLPTVQIMEMEPSGLQLTYLGALKAENPAVKNLESALQVTFTPHASSTSTPAPETSETAHPSDQQPSGRCIKNEP